MRTVALSDLARGGLLAFVVLVALEHPLRADLPAQDHFISEYASGATHPIAVVAFLAWAAGMAATALLAWRGGLRAVGVLVGLAALGACVAAAFATQTVAGELPPGAVRTTTGRLHDAGTLLILAGLLGGAVWGLRGVRTRRYRVGLAACAVAFFAAPAVLVAAALDWPGIGQRALVLVGVAYLALLLGELTTSGRRTPARGQG